MIREFALDSQFLLLYPGQEKKANRKQHQDEYSRICQELHRLKDQVHRTRNDYERCLDAYAVAKSKYEEQYTKGKMGKRLEDCRERYQV